jgi:hypothetical protein
MFFVLWVINPELLYYLAITSIVTLEREQGLPEFERLSDETIIQAVNHLARTLFVTRNELESFLILINKRVREQVRDNIAEKNYQMNEERWIE